MSGLAVIFRRELAGLFLQPLAWLLLFVALLVNGLFFTLFLSLSQGDANQALSFALGQATPFWAITLVLPPLLTMRMVSEEARSGLLEFLLTAPVRDGAVIVGKALAATCFLGVLWSSVPLYAAVLAAQGAGVDWGQVSLAFGGALLVSLLFCSVGLVASALSNTPLLAAFLGFVFNSALLLAPSLLEQARFVPREVRESLVLRIDVLAHLQASFLRGAFDSADLVYFLAWSAAALFLATRLLEMRRWR